MFDLHCHILPGIDDGPESVEDSLQMAQIADDDGIRAIVATPHVNNGVYFPHPDRIAAEVSRLNALLAEKAIPLTIVPGGEVALGVNLIADIRDGKIATINNRNGYLLLELPAFGIPQSLAEFIWELKLRAITPIIAHPERHPAIQDDVNRLYDLVQRGAFVQITAQSLTGGFGKNAQTCALSAVKHHLAHVIASDAHSPGSRPPVLSAGREAAQKVVGHELASRMVSDIPERIIHGEPFSFPSPEKRKARSFLGGGPLRWFRKMGGRGKV